MSADIGRNLCRDTSVGPVFTAHRISTWEASVPCSLDDVPQMPYIVIIAHVTHNKPQPQDPKFNKHTCRIGSSHLSSQVYGQRHIWSRLRPPAVAITTDNGTLRGNSRYKVLVNSFLVLVEQKSWNTFLPWQEFEPLISELTLTSRYPLDHCSPSEHSVSCKDP